METNELHASQGGQQRAERFNEEIIPVIREQAVITREVVETGKVKIKKKVTEETTTVNLPILNESYHIEHVQVPSKVLDTPPPAIRYEGEKTIITVLKEITVVQKKVRSNRRDTSYPQTYRNPTCTGNHVEKRTGFDRTQQAQQLC